MRSIGEDVSAGELLLPEGHRLRPVDVAAAAAAGATELRVRRKPRVAVIPTGDEIVPVGSPPQLGEILDTNSLMLVAQAQEAGCEAWATPIQPDVVGQISAAVREAAAGADLVIVVAGSSAGRDDYTARIVAELGVLAVHGVAVRPGHPVVLGAVDATPVVGAPGYPVSAALTFDIFARAAARGARGCATAAPAGGTCPARPQASLRGGDGRLGAGAARIGGRPGGGVAAAPRCRGADLAGASGRAAAGPGRRGGAPCG